MGRVVMHPENLTAAVDEHRGPLLEKLGNDIADDASLNAPKGATLKLSTDINPELDGDTVHVVADAHHDDEPADDAYYGYWAEVGTSDTPASRFLERALYKQRNP